MSQCMPRVKHESNVPFIWTIGRKAFNRIMHSIYGNSSLPVRGKTTLPKGNGKGKAYNEQQVHEELFLAEVRSAMPEAARMRLVPKLVQEEWSATVRRCDDLGNQGGVAVVYKEFLPSVLRAVGYTHQPTAILMTQPASQLGLRGYECCEVHCTILVRDDEGNQQQVCVKRHLIQLGFGSPVLRQATGDVVSIPMAMHKMVVKLPTSYGWGPEACTGSSLTTLLAKHVSDHALDSLQCRADQSATVLVHESAIHALLKASGVDSVSQNCTHLPPTCLSCNFSGSQPAPHQCSSRCFTLQSCRPSASDVRQTLRL